jgi:mannose-6-phosphate isomerase-like protein (cupin superfamily)
MKILILFLSFTVNTTESLPIPWDKVISFADSFPGPVPEDNYAFREALLEKSDNWEMIALDVQTLIPARVDTTASLYLWVISGEGYAMIGAEQIPLKANDVFRIPKDKTYAFTNKFESGTILLELRLKP